MQLFYGFTIVTLVKFFLGKVILGRLLWDKLFLHLGNQDVCIYTISGEPQDCVCSSSDITHDSAMPWDQTTELHTQGTAYILQTWHFRDAVQCMSC